MLTKCKIPQGLIENNDEGIPEVFRPRVITVNSFGPYCANQFVRAYNDVANSPQPWVVLDINSEGGSVFELNQMRDVIKDGRSIVVGIGGGMCFSAAALLLTSCTKGYRWMLPNSKLMIHEVATSSEGKSSDIISDALETEKLNDELFEVLSKNAGKPKSFFKNLVKKRNNADCFLSADECLRLNLIDHVGLPEVTMDVKINWSIENLSKSKADSKIKKVKKVKASEVKPAKTKVD